MLGREIGISRYFRPEIQHAGVLVVKPLAGGVELFEGVLEVVAVVRVEVVGAVFFQREQSRGGIERRDGLEEVPPAVLREDVELHVLGMCPGANVLGLHEERAFPKMPLRRTRRRKQCDEGPAAVERVLRVEVRITGEDLAFAFAEQLFGEKAFRQQLRDIGFDDLAGVFFPAGDFGAADEGAVRSGEGDVRIGGFERERREEPGGAFGEEDGRRRGVTGLAGLAEFFQRGVRREIGGDGDVDGMSEGQKGRKGQKGRSEAERHARCWHSRKAVTEQRRAVGGFWQTTKRRWVVRSGV